MAKRHSERNSKHVAHFGRVEPRQTPMTAFFAVISTGLSENRLAGARKPLAGLLAGHGIRLKAIRRQTTIVPAILRALKDRPRAPVAVIDEKTVNPAEAAWLRELLRQAGGLQGGVLPQVIYITRQVTAAGTAVAQTHPLLRGSYVQRDDKGQWVNTVADRIIELLKSASRTSKVAAVPGPARQDIPGIVGTSYCFREAVSGLLDIFRSPCGLVSGEVGVGKMFLLRNLFRYRYPADAKIVVLACGSFMNDYFVGTSHRVLVSGQEAIDRVFWRFSKAKAKVLVLHHAEQLPTAVQAELATVLQESAAELREPPRLRRVGKDGLEEYEGRIIATTTIPPELLARTGRMLPELVRRLAKHHVRIPPLRERGPEDIGLLVRDILPVIARRERRPIPEIDDDAVATLQRAVWPNNISDLVRALERPCRECRAGMITRHDLPPWVDTSRSVKWPLTLDQILAETERSAILTAVDYAGGDVAKAAEMLGRDPKGFYRRLKSLGIKTKRLQTDLLRRQMNR